MKTYNRSAAERIAQGIIRAAQEEAFAGAGHPDLVEWRKACLAAAKERLVLRLMGEPEKAARVVLPPLPEVEY